MEETFEIMSSRGKEKIMNNIIDKIVYKEANNLAKAIDDYCLKVFKTPGWITKRLWLYKWYAKLKRFEIKHYPDKLEFFVKDKKVGELGLRKKASV